MSAAHKRIKLLTEYIEQAGLELECFVDKKDGRITAQAVSHTGEKRLFSLSNSSTGDPRGDLNERSRIRRWAAEVGQPTQLEIKIKEKLPEIKRVIALEPKTPEQAAIMDAFDNLPKPTAEDLAPTDHYQDEDTPVIISRQDLLGVAQPPAPAPRKKIIVIRKKTTMPEATPAKPQKVTKLTMHEQYTVIERIKAIDTTEFEQPSTLAKFLNDEKIIPVEVPLKLVSDAVKMLGKKWKDRRGQHLEGTYRKDRAKLVAKELKALGDTLGYKFSDDFLAYLATYSPGIAE